MENLAAVNNPDASMGSLHTHLTTIAANEVFFAKLVTKERRTI